MYKEEVVLNNETGIHARPASLLVKEAAKYESDIKIIKDGKEYNGKSIMGIISMGAVKNTKLTIVAEGADEKELVLSIKDLIENKLED
ncbi:HPr family phosphocarrier protein [Wukongibacter sp. M2B1]|uniref:HPr family phosphocarrier protein n=1 Tax=Wukongibacter sp. M2B1 TaxID=3088895 RepID=UPI003D7AEE8D